MKTKYSMTMKSLLIALVVASGTALAEPPKTDGKVIPVTGDNYAQAEAAANFATWAKLGSDKQLFHYRDLAPVGPSAPTVRMNWDTLYSCRIVKVSDDHTFEVTLPKTDMYVSAQVIDENGFSPYFVVEKGVKKILKVDTDYAWVLFRTEVVDRKSKENLEKVHQVQDGIEISGMMEDSTYVMPNYDQNSLLKLRAEYTKEFLAGGAEFTFARKAGEVDQHTLNLSFAAGWGGYPPELNKSNAYSSSKNIPGDTCYSITFEDPKNTFFTSFTLYDTDSYLMAGETQIKSSTWKPNPDGTITLHFNCGKDAINNLSSGGKTFNYVVRNYGVSQTVLDGKFKPVDPKPVEVNNTKEQLAYSIGVQAYLYGQPIMDLYRTFYEGTLDPKRGHDRTLNEFNPARKLTTPKDTWVVSPNSDTLYLRSYLDLTDEPIVLHIPDMGERKFWFPLGNMYHNLLDHLSWDTIGFKGGDYALCAPGWQGVMPAGVTRVDMTTPMMWSLGRYSVSGQDDVAAVNKLQDETWYVPLSQWKKGMTSAPRAKVDPARYPVFTREDMTDPQKYFTTMNEMLRRNPPLAKDHALLGWFREINLHPEQQFDWDNLDPATQKGLTRATADALKIIEQKEKSFAKHVNGWVEAILDGDMSDDPVNHAGVTKMGLLYSQKEVSTYHVAYIDGDNQPLNGAHQYTVKLDPPPPVDAFWSLTMYDAKTQLYIENKINRYAFGDRTPGLQKDKDGSVTIYLQADEPTDPKAKANWLPAPEGAFYLALREYSPKPAILTREWVPPPIQRVK